LAVAGDDPLACRRYSTVVNTAQSETIPVHSSPRRLTSKRLIAFAIVIGVGGGIIATVYYYLLQTLLHGIWESAAHIDPASLPIEPAWHPRILAITTVGGLLVGLLTWWLGSAGEIAAVVDNIHLREGRLDIRQSPSMVTTSLISIASGGSAGPEAPLVQIIGSAASWLGDRLGLETPTVRTFTFCGMGAALGAFFGAPLGGALFALEIPHRRGIEYYEALLPALVSAVAAFLVFRAVVGYEPVIFHLAGPQSLTLMGVVWGMVFGALGAAVAAVFVVVFSTVGRISEHWHRHPVLLATLGGATIGLLGQLSPRSLFWSEHQMDGILSSLPILLAHHTLRAAVGLLLLLVIVKILAISATLHCGFRGGFIFPLMFMGACVGTAATALFPNLPAAVVVVTTMAAVNVAVTKTPVSTCVILVELTGASMMPALIAASLVSLLLTTRLNLIRTQRARTATEAPGPKEN
jgi:H+/Cl- antiporter ClcA